MTYRNPCQPRETSPGWVFRIPSTFCEYPDRGQGYFGDGSKVRLSKDEMSYFVRSGNKKSGRHTSSDQVMYYLMKMKPNSGE